jgi:hypothetical protein
MKRGDHVRVQRSMYFHHGIAVEQDRVVHFTGEPGSKSDAAIRETVVSEFSQGGSIEVVEYGKCLQEDETVRLARSRIGEADYHLVQNNCEHFARYCKTGVPGSEQVKDVAGGVGAAIGTGAAAAGSITVVASAGSAAGLSGAGILSGLAAIGPAGAVGGVVTLSGIPLLATNYAVSRTLNDDESLPSEERSARSAGRIAAKVGSGVGVAGTVGTISVVGTASGLSGAGIASGLAAVGSTVGGGMAAGVAISVAAPAVVAAISGWGLYKAVKWMRD